MVEKLRAIAGYLKDVADEIEDGNLTPDDWCSNKMGIDMEVYELNKIAEEMSKHYD